MTRVLWVRLFSSGHGEGSRATRLPRALTPGPSPAKRARGGEARVDAKPAARDCGFSAGDATLSPWERAGVRVVV